MALHRLEFIFIFLPVFLLLYYRLPARWRNLLLLAGSLAFYLLGCLSSPAYFLVLPASIAFNWAVALFIAPREGRPAGKPLLIAGVASADYHAVSAEQKAEAEQEITDDVYWTTFGHMYHLDVDCQAIVNSNTVYEGTVTEAIESGRTAICSFCAKRHADELDLDALNVEKEIGEEEAVAPAA
jgi:hypothetical protein